MKVSVLSLGLLPLTFGYAIFRYRLMDVDLIFKRGMVYTVAAAAIIGLLLRDRRRHGRTGAHPGPELGAGWVWCIAIVVTALLFDPLRKWIQERIDQFFYRTRYDYRQTLIEFGRELSAETDLDKMLSSVVEPAVANTAGRSHGDFSFVRRGRPQVSAGEVVRHYPDQRPGSRAS